MTVADLNSVAPAEDERASPQHRELQTDVDQRWRKSNHRSEPAPCTIIQRPMHY